MSPPRYGPPVDPGAATPDRPARTTALPSGTQPDGTQPDRTTPQDRSQPDLPPQDRTQPDRPPPDRTQPDRTKPGRTIPDVSAMSPRLRRRRAFSLVLLTLLLPGSAQLAAGSRRLGRLGLRAWLVLWAAALLWGIAFLFDRSLALGLVGRTWLLAVVEWVLVAYALVWAVLFADAWHLARPRRLSVDTRRLLAAVTVVMMVVACGAMAWAARSVAAARAAVSAVFAGSTTVEPTDGRYNILLLGADTGKDRVGTRPDSIQLVSIDAETGRAVAFGFSRDTENIDFRRGSVMRRLMPGGWNCGDNCLLNGLYTWATDHRSQFPARVRNPGVLATEEAVEALSGLDVHYYVMVDLRGFRKMIDALGGLDITVGRKTPIGGGTSPIVGWIEPGRQHLDGYHALWYARSRAGSTNYERMARQRCVTTAMLEQLDPQSVLLRFQKIASASSGLIQTDVPQSQLGYFADLALKARSQKIRSVNFVPPLMKPWDYLASFVTDTVRSTIAASERAKDEPKPVSTASATTDPAATPSAGSPNPTALGTVPTATASAPTTARAGAPSASPSRPVTAAASENDLSAVCQAG